MPFPSQRDYEIEATICLILRLESEQSTFCMDDMTSTGEDLADYLFDLLEYNCNGASDDQI
jgi:hypothetical protein